MTLNSLFFSRQLWRSIQIAPPPHWAGMQRQESRRSDRLSLLLMFALAAVALISGVMLSVLVVFRATDRIARDHENATFDLLAVTPPGGLGAAWARFTGFLHYDLTLMTVHRLRWLALGVLFVTGAFTLLTVWTHALATGDPAAQVEAWSWLLFYLFLLPMTYFDHIYAVVTGGLLSTLVPTFNTGDARVAVIFAVVGVHFTSYLIAALAGALILPTIYQSIGLTGWLADLTRPLLALVLFVLVHEAVVLLLYRQAQARLNGTVPARESA
jgi:hypothetical protein